MRPCLLQKIIKGTVRKWAQTAYATVPFEKNRQRHGQKVGAYGVCDRAFYKKSSKARSESGHKRHARPCLLKKLAKGTVRKWAQTACATVPFEKNRQRHGQNRSEAVVPDRAFWKKVAKARSKPEQIGHVRPCLLQKIIKGTVEIVARGSSPTVPFAKISQRHGQKILVRSQKARIVERKAPPASVRSRPSADDLYKKEARLRRASIDIRKGLTHKVSPNR